MMKIKRKVVLMGDGGVGKTSLIRRFVLNTFDDKYLVTLGTKVSKKVIMTKHPHTGADVELTLAIWDIMGHMGVTRVSIDYLIGAKGALVVSDVTRKDTLTGIKKWVDALREKEPEASIILLANKSDLIGQTELGVELSEYNGEEVKLFSEGLGIAWALTSAKTGENVENAFTSLGQMILD